MPTPYLGEAYETRTTMLVFSVKQESGKLLGTGIKKKNCLGRGVSSDQPCRYNFRCSKTEVPERSSIAHSRRVKPYLHFPFYEFRAVFLLF
jgi:hypothetical protein